MIQIICSECSSELDIDTTQSGSSIELIVSPCSCYITQIEELKDENEELNDDLEETKTQLSDLESKLYNLSEKLNKHVTNS